jgi:threonine/homoserine/homoserine lactone efflux protein
MPSLQIIGAFALIVTFIVISPGPNLFLLLRNTPLMGKRAGYLTTIGICAAILTHAVLSLTGVSALILASATLFSLVKLLGAAYLVWLGVAALRRAWTGVKLPTISAIAPTRGSDISARQALLQGWTANILNPKPALFYFAAFPQFIDPAAGDILAQGMLLGLVHVFIAACWYGLVVFGIDKANVWLRRPRIWRALQSASGVALAGLGLRLALVEAPK